MTCCKGQKRWAYGCIGNGSAECTVRHSFTLQNSLTRSGPKVTRPGPRGLGCTPSTASLVVGSDQSRSMSTMPPSSIVRGRCSCSISLMALMDRPMPVQHPLHVSICRRRLIAVQQMVLLARSLAHKHHLLQLFEMAVVLLQCNCGPES